jgi:hypothetical protein
MATNSSHRCGLMAASMSSSGASIASTAACPVLEGEDDEFGRLVHKPGGAEHARWIFDYDETAEDDDEAGYRFGDHAFRNGEYVSIRDEDGEMHTFQVVSVEPAT